MALTLPQGTTVGETYTDGTSTWVYNGTGWEYLDPSKTYFQAEAPAVAVEGQNWTDTDNGRLYTYLQGQWINEGSVFESKSTEEKTVTLSNTQGANPIGSPATWRDVEELEPKLQKFANPDNSGTTTGFGGVVVVSNNYMATTSTEAPYDLVVEIYKKVDKKWNHIHQITGISVVNSYGSQDQKHIAIYDMSDSIMNTFGSSPANTGGCLLAVADNSFINNPGELYTTKGKVHIYGIAGDQVKEIGVIECPLRDEEANYGDGNYEQPGFGAHIQFMMPAVDSDAWRRGEGELIVTAPQYRSADRQAAYATGRVFKFKLPHQPSGSAEHILPEASTSLANWNTMYNNIVPASKVAVYRKEGVKGFGSSVGILDNNDLAIGAGTIGTMTSRDTQSVLLYDEANYPGESFTHQFNSDGTTNEGSMLGQLGRTSVDNSASWIAYGDGLASGGIPFTPTNFSDPDQIRKAELGESSSCGEVIIYHKASKKSIRLQTPEINGIRQTMALFGQSVAIWNDCILLVGAPNAIGYGSPGWNSMTLQNWNSTYNPSNLAMPSYNMALGHGAIFMYALETSSSGDPVVTELAKWGLEGGTTPEIYNSPFYFYIFRDRIAEENNQSAIGSGAPSINANEFGAGGDYSSTTSNYFGWDIKISPDQMTLAISTPQLGPFASDPNQNNGSMTVNGGTMSYSGNYQYQDTYGCVMLFNLKTISGISQGQGSNGWSNAAWIQNPLASTDLYYNMIKYQVPANSIALSNTKLVVGYKNVKFNHDPRNYSSAMYESGTAANHGYAAVYDISSTGSSRPTATFRSILLPPQINMEPFGPTGLGFAQENTNTSSWFYYGQSVAVSDNYIAVSASGLSPDGNGAIPRAYGQSSVVYVYDVNDYSLLATCDTISSDHMYGMYDDPVGRTDHNLYPFALNDEDRYTAQQWNGSSAVDGPWAYNAKFNSNIPCYLSLGTYGAVGASLEISGQKIMVGAPEIGAYNNSSSDKIYGVIFTFDMDDVQYNEYNQITSQSVQHSENYDITGKTWNQYYLSSGFGFNIQPAVEAHGSETPSNSNNFYETLMPYTLKSRTIGGKFHISVPYGMSNPNFQDSSIYYTANVKFGYGRDLVINNNFSTYGGIYIFDRNGNYKNLLSPTTTVQSNSISTTDLNILSANGTTGDSLPGKFGHIIRTTDNYLIVYDPSEHMWASSGNDWAPNYAYVPTVSIFNKSDLSFVDKIIDPDWNYSVDYFVSAYFGRNIEAHGNRLYIPAAEPQSGGDQTMVDRIYVYDLDTRGQLLTLTSPNRDAVLNIVQTFYSPSITSWGQSFGTSMSISDKNMVFGAPGFINGSAVNIGAFYVASTAKDGVDVYYSKHSDDNISTDLQSLDTATEHTQEFIGYITGSTYDSSTVRRLGAVTINTASTAQGDGFAPSTGTNITSWDPETSGYVQTLVSGIAYYGMITYTVVPGETEGSPVFSLMGMNPDTNEIQIPGVPGNETHILDGTRLFFVGIADSETNISLLPNPTDLVQPTMLSTNSGGGSVVGTLPTAEGMPKPWETV